jgi:hypothetical protein
MATVTVPGFDGATITYANLFLTPQNLLLALGISNALAADSASGLLNVQNYVPPPGTTSPAVSGDVNELVVTSASDSGTVTVPSGYTFVVDDTGSSVGGRRKLHGRRRAELYWQ